MDPIATTGKVAVVLLTCGGKAFVRRAKRSLVNDVASVAGLTGDMASGLRFAEVMCRAAIVGGENLADPDDNASVVFSIEKHPVLGTIASRQVYDALTTADVTAVMQACGAKINSDGAIVVGELAETKAGN